MQTMNTQKILMAGFALFLMLFALPLIIAEENESSGDLVVSASESESEEVIQGIDEDFNESVSEMDIGLRKLGLFFTFNQEKKAEKELNLARLELIRARHLARTNNTAAMEKSLEAHNRYIERVQARINSLEDDSTKERIRNSAEKLVGLERATQVHELRIQKLKNLISEDSNLSEEQIEIIQQKIDKAEENTQHLREVQLAKEERIKTKLMAVENMSEEEAEEEIDSLRSSSKAGNYGKNSKKMDK